MDDGQAFLANSRERIRSSLWVIPAAFVLLSILLALALTALDRELENTAEQSFIFGGSAEAARSILSVIAGSVVSLTGLVFSILVVVFQLTSSQFSPRAVRTFMQDRISKITLASFLGTFAFSLVVLRSIREANGAVSEFIPRISITAAVAGALLSMGIFVFYIHHISLSIRVSSIIERIHAETASLIEKSLPEAGEGREAEAPLGHVEVPAGPARTVKSEGAGYLVSLNAGRLVRSLAAEEAVARLVPKLGEFVGGREPLLEVWGGGEELPQEDFRRCIILDQERTLQQDIHFGLRQLADIAVRALSPGINDPTTARNALDRMGDLLLMLGRREPPSEAHRDEEGRLRLIVNRPSWDEIVLVTLGEIAYYGRDSPLVARDLRLLVGRLRRGLPAPAGPPLGRIEGLILQGDLEGRLPVYEPR